MNDQRDNNKSDGQSKTADFSCQTESKKDRIRQQEDEYVRDKFEKVKLESPKKK